MNSDDTIAAISTPIGVGGISVIRISGTRALDCANQLLGQQPSLSQVPSHTVHFRDLYDPDSATYVDSVLISVLRAPNTFTGDDTVEISCHGGVLNTYRVLSIVLKTGARQAKPGEFTQTAFLNGKMDLAQIESIADLIHAKTEGARRATAAQLHGNLSAVINSLREDLLNLCALIELDLDFSEEQLIDVERNSVLDAIGNAILRIDELLKTFDAGRVLREGARISIVGKPNVGKSSLLNCFLNTDRAIVSTVPGTTRDYLEEVIDIQGIPFIIVDTAGLRQTDDTVELAGIARTGEHIERSDIVLAVFDTASPPEDNDMQVLDRLSKVSEENPHMHVVHVCNKSDIGYHENWTEILSNRVYISARTGEGVDRLRSEIAKRFSSNLSFESAMIFRIRHKQSLEKSRASLSQATDTIRLGKSFEFAAIDIRDAVFALGEIIGLVTTQEVLDNIFSRFCIGK